jgi:hypothetical protein
VGLARLRVGFAAFEDTNGGKGSNLSVHNLQGCDKPRGCPRCAFGWTLDMSESIELIDAMIKNIS